MIKVKDGYAKLIGTTYSGSVSRVLLSNGGDHILGNSNGNIPLNNRTVNTNLNADMLDGLHIHAGRNNEVNKIVRTDANGFLQTGWINTTSGDIGTGAINKIYCSNDDYIRYKTPANFFPTLANSGNNISITVAGQNRTLTVGYATNTDKVDGYHAESFIKKHTEYNFNSNGTAPYKYIWLCRISNKNSYSGLALTLDINSCYHKHYQVNMLISTGQYAYSSSSISINKSDGAPDVYYVRTANGSDIGYDYFDIYVTCGAWNTGGYKIINTNVNGSLLFTNKCTLVDSVPSGAVAVGLMYSSVNYANSAGSASSATKVIVNQHTANDVNYPLVWSNQANTNSVTENQLFKSWSDLYYNPKNKRLTVGGSVVASSFVKNGSDNTYVLLGGGGHKLISDFATSSHTHSYITIPTCSSLDENSNNFSVEYASGSNSVATKPSGVDAFGVMRLRTAGGWYGQILMSANTAPGIYYRSANGLTSSIGWIKLLDSSNSSVSGGGNTWRSSITVNINGTSKTLTIPKNPNTDYRVTQSETTTANYRPLVIGYTNVSTAGSGMAGSVTNQVYLSNKFYVQPSTGNLYATTFVGALSGNATTASKWATARTLTIGNTGKVVDGSANVSWTLAEIGAATSRHTHSTITFNNGGSGGASGSTYNGSASLTVSYNTIGARRDLAPSVKAWFTGTPRIDSYGVMEVGRYIDFHPTHTSSLDYSVRLDATTSTAQRQIYLPSTSGTLELVGHTHILSLVTDTGDSSIALMHGGKYKLTAGGNSIIFTLPADNNTAHTKFAWTNGSTAGPTGSLSGNHTAVSFPAIPSATASISGIVTTGTQTFTGKKTFNGHITLGGGSYQLKRVAHSSAWYNGRDNAIVRQTSASGYSVIMSSKTINGSWEIGNDDDDLCFTYITDSNYNSKNDDFLGILYITSEGKVHSNNDIYATHFFETSDIRYKKILKNLSINSNIIANLPLFDFEWIENNTIGTGTSAQAVQQILPNIVSGTDKLTLDYGVLGTIAGITACKELVTQKSELQQLKEKVRQLEDKLRKYENI